MACTITQADLGAAFAAVDSEIADLAIETALVIVLGVAANQAVAYAKWIACGLDPCTAARLMASHILATTTGSGAEDKTITSERVGGIAVSYATAASASGLYAGSVYGSMYAMLLSKFEVCSNRRRSMPVSVVGGNGCGCA